LNGQWFKETFEVDLVIGLIIPDSAIHVPNFHSELGNPTGEATTLETLSEVLLTNYDRRKC